MPVRLNIPTEVIWDPILDSYQKTRGFGWGLFKEQQRRFKTAQKRRNPSGAP